MAGNEIKPDRIILGYPLDLLLNRECLLTDYEISKTFDRLTSPEKNGDYKGKIGGIVLPDEHGPGTGNIIIRGRPGTGKSTLALQMAVACPSEPNNYIAAYFSLEERAENILTKAKFFGWEKDIKRVCQLTPLDEFSNPEEYGETLLNILTQKEKECPFFNSDIDSCINCSGRTNHKQHETDNLKCVIVPSLSPRSLGVKKDSEDSLFWIRYHELEKLLIGAKWLREQSKYKGKISELRVVVVDSLNVFGDQLLSREELYGLFDLFKKYQVIGIFVVEEDEGQTFSPDSRLHGDIIEYLADLVISLSTNNESGYFTRIFEITKSRYQHQIYGKHPFRISQNSNLQTSKKYSLAEHPDSIGKGIIIFPSLHYIVSGTDKHNSNSNDEITHQFGINNSTESENKFDFGIENINPLLPKKSPFKKVGLIEGPRGTFKTILAQNFLMSGFINNEKVLLIRLKDRSNFNPGFGLTYNTNVKNAIIKIMGSTGDDDQLKFKEFKNSFIQETSFMNFSSICVDKWINPYIQRGKIFEINFKSGYLLSEEFIEIVREIILNENKSGTPITRVVLDDISVIGVSYPFLKNSPTAGDMFITAFIHVMRNYNINLVIVGTTDQLKDADDAVNRSKTLSDFIIDAKVYDVFGDRFVLVFGDGLKFGYELNEDAENEKNKPAEFVPGIINPISEDEFDIDLERLEGLVGFESGNIHRPGLTLHLFEAGPILKDYHREISNILQCAFPSQSSNSFSNYKFDHQKENRNFFPREDTKVDIIPYDESLSESIHDSLSMLGGAPIDRTVLFAVDEFFKDNKKFLPLTYNQDEYIDVYKQKNQNNSQPYYGNVLLLAYKIDEQKELKNNNSIFWSDLTTKIVGNNKYNRPYKIHSRNENEGCKNCKIGQSLCDFDDNSEETLACFLMDAIFSSDELKNAQTIKEKMKILGSLQKGFSDGIKLQVCDFVRFIQHSVGKVCNKKGTGLCPNASVYFCWYSQLRELIINNPNLTNELEIRPLPGKGFTGDWRIGIMRGSVSINLGRKTIEMLCSEKEEYKRFALGVGLPVRKKFKEHIHHGRKLETNFYAWPGSDEIMLDEVFKIHKEANRRSYIKGYTKIRGPLAKVCKQLLDLNLEDESGTNKNDIIKANDEKIMNIVNRLLEQIRLFAPEAFYEQ
jgi:KaiC/GvpD/RAD55 family RecA-like ATPase